MVLLGKIPKNSKNIDNLEISREKHKYCKILIVFCYIVVLLGHFLAQNIVVMVLLSKLLKKLCWVIFSPKKLCWCCWVPEKNISSMPGPELTSDFIGVWTYLVSIIQRHFENSLNERNVIGGNHTGFMY